MENTRKYQAEVTAEDLTIVLKNTWEGFTVAWIHQLKDRAVELTQSEQDKNEWKNVKVAQGS